MKGVLMSITQTIEQLREMKFSGFIEALEEQESNPEYHQLTFQERLTFLVQKEYLLRKNRQLTSRIKRANFRLDASIEGLSFRAGRNLDRERVLRLSECEWIRQRENIIITGPTGAGKSYLACAFGHRACLMGKRVKYFRFPRFLSELDIAMKAGKQLKFYSTLSKADVIIFDDWGITKIGQSHSLSLLEVLEDRYQTKSTIITAQIPVENWYDTIEDPTIADAILDRIVHHTHRFELTGQSIRKNPIKKGATSNT
jgi:DNA replication protein DnaC